jgi:hypothetical protein
MQVLDRLTGLAARVDHQAIASLEAFLLRNLTRHDEEPSQETGVLSLNLLHAFNMIIRDDEHMRGRLRVLIVKGCYLLILKDDAR